MATIFVLVCALAVSAAQSAEWIKVSPLGAGFSVLMPAKPEAEVKLEIKSEVNSNEKFQKKEEIRASENNHNVLTSLFTKTKRKFNIK